MAKSRSSRKNASKKKPYQPKQPSPRSSRFLFPLTLPLVSVAQSSPLIERLLRRPRPTPPLPASLLEGDVVLGTRDSLPAPAGPNELQAILPRNLRVAFVLREMSNVVVSGGGVLSDPDLDKPETRATWFLHSPAATHEQFEEPVGLAAPGPGQTWPITHVDLLYNGLVTDGCGATPVFPISITSTVRQAESAFSEFHEIGEFQASDDSTLTPNGFWNFNYTIRAEGLNGGVSDFRFKGFVFVGCTNLENFG